jgi:hypothetical protein
MSKRPKQPLFSLLTFNKLYTEKNNSLYKKLMDK